MQLIKSKYSFPRNNGPESTELNKYSNENFINDSLLCFQRIVAHHCTLHSQSHFKTKVGSCISNQTVSFQDKSRILHFKPDI